MLPEESQVSVGSIREIDFGQVRLLTVVDWGALGQSTQLELFRAWCLSLCMCSVSGFFPSLSLQP